MPEFVRVKVKSTGALIWIDRVNISDTVEVCSRQPARAYGQLEPKPQAISLTPPDDVADVVVDEEEADADRVDRKPEAPAPTRRGRK